MKRGGDTLSVLAQICSTMEGVQYGPVPTSVRRKHIFSTGADVQH